MKKLLLITAITLGAIVFPPVQAKVCTLCPSDNFTQLISDNAKVVVDFYSPGCPPCRRLKPIFEELGAEMSGILFIIVNVQEFSNLASTYKVSSIPHLTILKNGKQIDYSIGFKSKTALKSWIDLKLS
jgi:thioredoxin 1